MDRFDASNRPIAQKLFDQMVTKITKQGRAAVASCGGGQQCALRSDDGTLCCAAGALIKDEHFKRDFNFQRVTSPNVIGMIAESQDMTPEQLTAGWFPNFIRDCQFVHDNAWMESGPKFVELVTDGFNDVAISYGLQMPVPA